VVTESRTEEIVTNTRLLTEALSDRFPVGILRTDLDGNCMALNSRGADVLGIPEGGAAGCGWQDTLEEATRTGLPERWRLGTAESRPFEERLQVRVPGGPIRSVFCRVVRLPAEGERAAGFLASLLDVTEWQETEETLRKTTRELATRVRELDCLFEISRAVERSAGSLPRILGEVVKILRRTWSNGGEAFARIALEGLDYSSENFIPGKANLCAPVFVHGARAGEIEVGFRFESASEPGESPTHDHQRLLEAVAERLGRTAERVKGRQLLREKEEEMRERLTHLTRVSTMGEMASNIAHEVNQPLTAIATYAQASRRMLEGGDPQLSRLMEVLGHIADEALRAGNIIHRLKDMVRRQESRWTRCDLNALVRDVEQLASVDARLHDVSLSFQLSADLPAVQADGVQIQQVVLNLIRNGIDAVEGRGAGEGRVVVRTGRVGPKSVRLSVEDNGRGLPADAEDKLFQPFFTTKPGGMGMGLSISKSIASAHKGRISFTRNASEGMTFHLTLPAFDLP
jgi:signal transduction histidine kinase